MTVGELADGTVNARYRAEVWLELTSGATGAIIDGRGASVLAVGAGGAQNAIKFTRKRLVLAHHTCVASVGTSHRFGESAGGAVHTNRPASGILELAPWAVDATVRVGTRKVTVAILALDAVDTLARACVGLVPAGSTVLALSVAAITGVGGSRVACLATAGACRVLVIAIPALGAIC